MEVKKENRLAVEKIFTSLRFFGGQDLAIRGKEEATSNLLLQEQMKTVAELNQWLQRKEKIKNFSPALTNEILNDFSRGVSTTLQQDFQNPKYYAIILDETLDVSDKKTNKHLFSYYYEQLRCARGILWLL